MKRQGELGVKMHYAENPFGRRRIFAPANSREEEGSVRREAGNAIIQSTVADALMLAMCKFVNIRNRIGSKIRIINPIHDALMLLAPDSEVETGKKMLEEVMGSIAIPTYDAHPPFCLGVDITSFKRWGSKE
jgi:DNA polymerase I-like protein with 3'-5' exonuclease and polymerase domains